MGSILLKQKAKGKKGDYNGVFKEIQQQCIREYGEDSYNGTFSTCYNLYFKGLNSNKYSEKEEKKILEKYNDCDLDTGCAMCIDLGVLNYEITTTHIEKEKVTKTPKFKKSFIVRYIDNRQEVEESFPTKKLAEEHAIKISQQGFKFITIEQGYSLIEGNPVVSRIKTTKKVSKTIPKNLKSNQICDEIHVYYFIGYGRM